MYGWFTPQRHQLAGDGKHTIKNDDDLGMVYWVDAPA